MFWFYKFYDLLVKNKISRVSLSSKAEGDFWRQEKNIKRTYMYIPRKPNPEMPDPGSPRVNSFRPWFCLLFFCPSMSKPCALLELFLLSETWETKRNHSETESRTNLLLHADLYLRWKSSLCLLADFPCQLILRAPTYEYFCAGRNFNLFNFMMHFPKK